MEHSMEHSMESAASPVAQPTPPPRPYFTRSTKTEAGSWKAAGVLPFAYHDGACWLLLGGEMVRTGPGGKFNVLMFSDFGGQREAIDDDPESTAGRECSEETLGMLYGCSSADATAVKRSTEELTRQLRARTGSICVVHKLRQGAYHMFISHSRFVDPLFFALATEQNAARASPVQGAEKSLFAWVPVADVLKAVAHARKSYLMHTHTRIVSRMAGQRATPKKILLHPCFANSLRMAVASGLLALVKACQASGSSGPQGHPQGGGATDAARAVAAAGRVKPLTSSAAAAAASGQQGGSSGSGSRAGEQSAAPEDTAGPLPSHMWWTLLQANVAQQLDITVPPEAARYSEIVQDRDDGGGGGGNVCVPLQ
ncbi:hypothetical protein FOA52_004779 [Chlamydomonas sp. UWO 241]|nr:hypothetical protein FOA52_004779 [Chlamydomonas sp. UWO 241]